MQLLPEVKTAMNGIKSMEIRGARLIAKTAVECLRLTAERSEVKDIEAFVGEMDFVSKSLLSTRPTAVSLPNGIRYVMYRILQAQKQGLNLEEVKGITEKACKDFLENVEQASMRIAEIGARRVSDGDIILTHCHSTAVMEILKKAEEQGKRIQVYVTETRPLMQGRIVAEILQDAGIPVTFIVDGAARHFMKKVDKVIVGADAVAANGAVVNKIGTSMVALAAHEARTLFFVAAETYKFSPETIIGELVKIEERPLEEVIPLEIVSKWKNVEVRNPSFDVTPPDYIDLIITERGIIPPQAALTILQQEFGPAPYEEQARYSTYFGETVYEPK